MFESVFGDTIIRRAVDRNLVSIHFDNIRDYTDDRHKTVDDYLYGGDPGMLLKPEPLARAITASRQRLAPHEPKVVFLSPQGRRLDQQIVKDLAGEKSLILLCGRYKGVDERIRQRYVDMEISIGDYVLSGGEIGAMVLVDAIVRLIPGVLGHLESAEQDSFYHGLLAPPHYTRPEVFEGMAVPQVLLSGHHAKVQQWQQEQARQVTQKLRPDLWQQWLADHPGALDPPKKKSRWRGGVRRVNEGTSERVNEGTSERVNEGTSERVNESTGERVNESTGEERGTEDTTRE
jgi:tRNA (guanine37-N1)-methyltransferase